MQWKLPVYSIHHQIVLTKYAGQPLQRTAVQNAQSIHLHFICNV